MRGNSAWQSNAPQGHPQRRQHLRQIALAWLLAQKPYIVPIPGTRRRQRLEENIGAAPVELTSEDIREIDAARSDFRIHGARGTEDEEYG